MSFNKDKLFNSDFTNHSRYLVALENINNLKAIIQFIIESRLLAVVILHILLYLKVDTDKNILY